MRPKTRREAMARDDGHEYRHMHQQGTRSGRVSRRLTRKQSNRAMRQCGKDKIAELNEWEKVK